MMKYLTALAFTMLAVNAEAQSSNQFMQYPSGGGGSLGTSPGAGILVDTDGSSTWTARCLAAGTGIAIANECGAAGNMTITLDATVTYLRAQGTSDPPATCTAQQDWYLETDTDELYHCYDTNLWTMVGLIADDSVVVGSGTSAAAKAIPDCDDSSGNHLNYDTTTNAFSCGTSSSATAFDPSTGISIVEEFIGGTTTTGAIGAGGYQVVATASGTIDMSAVPLAQHPGLLSLHSHATNDNSGARVAINSSTGSDNWGSSWDDKEWTFDALVRISHAGAITNSALACGLMTSTIDLTTAGIYLIRDTDRSHTAWVAQICDSATTGCQEAGDNTNSDTITSASTPVAQDWVRLRIRHDLTGVGGNPTIYFRVQDGTELTACSSGCDEDLGNLPTVSMFPQCHWLTRTTTEVKTSLVDYVAVTLTGLTRY